MKKRLRAGKNVCLHIFETTLLECYILQKVYSTIVYSKHTIPIL